MNPAETQKTELARLELELRKEYWQARKELVQGARSASDAFDKTVFTLSAGALGLSITFLKDIIGPYKYPNSIQFLIVAWFCYISVLVIQTTSLRLAHQAFTREVKKLNQEFEQARANLYGKSQEQMLSASEKYSEDNRLTVWVVRFTWLSILFFVIGTAALATFSVLNL